MLHLFEHFRVSFVILIYIDQQEVAKSRGLQAFHLEAGGRDLPLLLRHVPPGNQINLSRVFKSPAYFTLTSICKKKKCNPWFTLIHLLHDVIRQLYVH